jgi:hypothetical protein
MVAPVRDVAAAIRALGWRRVAAPTLIAITVAQAVLDRGGFTVTAKVVFVVLAALAAGAALLAGDGLPFVTYGDKVAV